MKIEKDSHADYAALKENPAVFLIADANFALQCARDAQYCGIAESSSQFARMSILLYAVSLEAFINFVYEYSDVPNKEWKTLSHKDKWLKAAQVCLPLQGIIETEDGIVYRPDDPIEHFRESEDPFASFMELKEFRDRMVHLKTEVFGIKCREVSSHLERKEYYPVSRLPKRLKLCNVEHAEIARRVYDRMTAELDRQMKGIIFPHFQSGAHVETVVEQTWELPPRVRQWLSEDNINCWLA